MKFKRDYRTLMPVLYTEEEFRNNFPFIFSEKEFKTFVIKILVNRISKNQLSLSKINYHLRDDI